jgi:hypothetical protein
VYDECNLLNITAMGIAPEQVLDYQLGKMRYMLPFGTTFGDESNVFIRLVDEVIMLGGGLQSLKEVLLAAQIHKPITILQGFGGAADQLTPQILPTARFVQPTMMS